ncbi:MAG TPA: extensin family protein [Thermohalobaculum sp.]|nr:extensin family protein [Thermohalobaculum sp.]
MSRTRLSAAPILLCLLSAPLLAEAPEDAPVPPEVPEALREGAQAEARAAEEAPEDAAEAGPAEEAAEAAEAAAEAAEAAEEAVEAVEAIDNELDEPDEPVVVAPPDAGPTFDPKTADACEAELAELGVRFERVEALEGEGPCGAPQPLRVSAIGGVELRPEITVRCPAARALALWIDRVAAPLAELYMEQEVAALLTPTGYQCRRRRGDGTAKWSEHSFANAVDVSGLMFENGDTMAIRPREDSQEPERSYQAGIRGGACAFFTTVLGPTTNGAHADHLHLDMAERRGGYRLCE